MCDSLLDHYVSRVVMPELRRNASASIRNNTLTADAQGYLTTLASDDVFNLFKLEIDKVKSAVRGKQMLRFFGAFCECTPPPPDRNSPEADTNNTTLAQAP